jgi:hypothetical protein
MGISRVSRGRISEAGGVAMNEGEAECEELSNGGGTAEGDSAGWVGGVGK